MSETQYKPSDFAKLGKPCCSRWGKSEIEQLALAYVEALAAAGDTWRKLSKKETYDLLTDDQLRFVHFLLKDGYYDHWFEMIRDQISDSDGALGVRGFWNTCRLGLAAQSEGEGR